MTDRLPGRESHRFAGQSQTEINTENIRVVDDALHQVRRLALTLRPSILDDLGLAPALHWLTAQTAKRTGLALEFHPATMDQRLAPEIPPQADPHLRCIQDVVVARVREKPGDRSSQHLSVALPPEAP